MNGTRITALAAVTFCAACADLSQPLHPTAPAMAARKSGSIGIIDLGTLGGNTSQAWAVNTPADGRPLLIVGDAQDASGQTRATYWYYDAASGAGSATRLSAPDDDVRSTAFAVNQSEQIAAWSYALTATGNVPRAIRWTPAGAAKFLGDFGGGSGQASGINSVGQISGYATSADGNHRLFRWDPQPEPDGSLNDLGVFGTDIQAVDINLSGTIVGGARLNPDDLQRAFVWRSPGPVVFLPDSGRGSNANAVNDAGVIVGFVNTTSSALQAVRWTPAGGGTGYVLENLGLGPSRAFDINNAGEIVGSYRGRRGSTGFYLLGSIVKELPLLSNSAVATEINERGDVVGHSYFRNKYTHAVLWTNVRGP